MIDVVLNRRILVVLIPALEKSPDETANLGKIVAATLKGMMGSTLGATVEGESGNVIENKPTHSATPFMTVFDEVGYYTSAGMAVMAAQARSLGFSLIFAAQDLPALEKRVKEEARSITANCNIKIFGKLEDPTQTKEFFEKTVGSAFVTELQGFQGTPGSLSNSYFDTFSAGVQVRARASYEGLRGFKEGQAVIAFGESVTDVKIFYSNPGFAKAMRVTRYMALPPPDENIYKHIKSIQTLRDNLMKKNWTAAKADVAAKTPDEFRVMAENFKQGKARKFRGIDTGIYGVVSVHALANPIDWNIQPNPGISGGSSSSAADAQSAGAADRVEPQVFTPAQAPAAAAATAQAAPIQTAPVRQDPPVSAPVSANAAPPRMPVAANRALDPEAARILRGAAKDARGRLFKGKVGKPPKGDVEAAE
jgi:intracellular multiplication protein IcmO